jgi:two-component system, sensor histidine kinase
MQLSIQDQRWSRSRFAVPPDQSGGEPRKDKTKSGSSQSTTRRKRVLVIEDNLDSMRSLVMLLKYEGHDAEFAINGYAALKLAERFKPEVVILDIGLPDINGYDICKWLKQHSALKHARVIAVTGYGSETDKAKALAAGCERHITKPYDTNGLLALIASD